MRTLFGELSVKERFDPKRFRFGEKASKKPVLLSHRRIFILPTGRGLCFAALILIMLLASTIYGNNLGFILTFLLGSIGVVSILHSFRTLVGLVFSTKPCQPVFAGDKAVLNCQIENGSRSPRISVQLRAGNAKPAKISIGAQSNCYPKLSITLKKRGWYNIGTIRIFTYFPLGLFRAWSPLQVDRRILVYPRPAQTYAPIPSEFSWASQAGRVKRGEEDFIGFQQYYRGDSVKKIYWKAVAKEQGLHTKQYADDLNDFVWLDWAQTPGRSIERKLSRLCRWVLDAEKSGLTYGIRLPASKLDPGSGQTHQSRCLKELALFGHPRA